MPIVNRSKILNKMTFNRTRSVQCCRFQTCACAVDALILLRVVNLSLKMDSATSICYMTPKALPFDASCFRPLWRFFTAHAQFREYYDFRFKNWHHIWVQRTHFYQNVNTLRSGLCCRNSVCRLSVCNVGAPYSGGWSLRQYFFTAVYAGYPLTSVQNFTKIALGEPLRRER